MTRALSEAPADALPLTRLNSSTVFEMLPVPAFVKNLQLVITHANPALVEFLHRRRDEIVGHVSAEFDLVDAVFHSETDRRVLAEGGTAIAPFQLKRNAADQVEGEVFKMRLDDVEGRAVGLLCVLIDRSRERAAEKHLREREADHERHVKATMVQTVQALCATVERRDPYVVGHQQRVSDLAVAIGRRLGLDEQRLEGLRLAAIVHDIGKINVPSEILNKPGRLSEAEFAIVKGHAEAGYEILKDIDFPWPIARMVREHHEAIDGSGYPLGLSGGDLLLESRILAVADVLEAVTSHRPYRPALGLEKGLAVLREMRGSKLDPQAVDACLDLVERSELAVPGWT